MITFFRTIRKNLLGSGQARKYLLYALGEIALVVVGILIALQVNNWNESRKEEQEAAMIKAGYIQSLHKAILQDASTFQNWASKFSSQEKWARYVGYILESKNKKIDDSLKFINYYRDASLHFVVSQKPLVWNELISSGGRQIMADEPLMDRLNEYYQKYEVFFENFFAVPFEKRMELRSIDQKLFQINENADYTEDDDFDIIPSRATYEAILNDPEILGLIRSIVVSAGFQDRFLTRLSDNAKDILHDMEESYPDILKSE